MADSTSLYLSRGNYDSDSENEESTVNETAEIKDDDYGANESDDDYYESESEDDNDESESAAESTAEGSVTNISVYDSSRFLSRGHYDSESENEESSANKTAEIKDDDYGDSESDDDHDESDSDAESTVESSITNISVSDSSDRSNSPSELGYAGSDSDVDSSSDEPSERRYDEHFQGRAGECLQAGSTSQNSKSSDEAQVTEEISSDASAEIDFSSDASEENNICSSVEEIFEDIKKQLRGDDTASLKHIETNDSLPKEAKEVLRRKKTLSRRIKSLEKPNLIPIFKNEIAKEYRWWKKLFFTGKLKKFPARNNNAHVLV